MMIINIYVTPVEVEGIQRKEIQKEEIKE